MRSLTKLAAALAVALPLIGAAGTAQARDSVSIIVGVQPIQWGGWNRHERHDRYRALPPGIIRSYMRQHYREVSRPERRGDIYVARGEDSRGRDLRITADAYSGRILDVQYTRRDRDRWDDRQDRREDRWEDRREDRRDYRRDEGISYYR